VNCAGGQNCFGAVTASGGGRRARVDDGGLSTSADAYAPAFGAAPGWDFATGLGSINAFNLAFAWFISGQ